MSSARLLGATFLLSAGTLLFEVALTRLLSLGYYSGFVFTVLSAALLGIGLGAAAAAAWPALRQPGRLPLWAALAALSAAAVTAASGPLAATSLPLLLIILALLPFAFSGLALSSIFSLWPQHSHRIYWADLLGAGSGTMLALPLLAQLSAASTALTATLLSAGAALLFSWRSPAALAATVMTAAALLFSVSGVSLGPDPARLATVKPLTGELQAGAELLATRSNAFARSDLIRRPATGAHYLYLDGAAGSFVPETDAAGLRSDIGYLAFEAVQPDSAFLLGVGGGLDAALARLAGTGRIVAAELNGEGISLVRELSDSALSDTEIFIDEGRSVLRQLTEPFDLIFLSHVITQASDLRGFALSEASTYTTEAFTEYLQSLTPEGMLAIKLYDELTLSRALFTAWAALVELGAQQPHNHLFAALDQSSSAPLPLLLVSREPLGREQAVMIARAAEARGHALLYIPHLLANPPLDRLAEGEATLEQLISEAAAGGVDLSPVRDSAPYFFQFETGLPQLILPLAWAAAGLVVLSLALAVGRSVLRRRTATWPAAPLVFGALGAGYIALQLSIIQRSQLLLGHPTLTLTLVLATLLLGGGFGSLLGRRLRRPLLWAPLLIIISTVLWHVLMSPGGALLAGATPPVRALLLCLSLLPIALLLGIPLPAGLRQLQAEPPRVAAAWAINGVHSVSGSIIAVSLALLYGQQAALLFALACYAVVLLGSVRLRTAA